MIGLPKISTVSPSKTSKTASNEFGIASNYEGSDRYIAAISYLYFVSAAILLLRRDNSEFVVSHSKHAVLLLLLALMVFIFVPGSLKVLFSIIIFAVSVLAAFLTSQGKRMRIPYLSEIANAIEI